MPRVRNRFGEIIWSVNELDYYHHSPRNGQVYYGTWYVEGGMVVVKDDEGNVVEAYQLKPGEIVESTN